MAVTGAQQRPDGIDIAVAPVPAAPRLRDLDADEFRVRYGCDRFTATVLANRFRYVVSHMSNQFRWHAFSPIIRDYADLCGMLSGPPALGYPMAAVSETMPVFYGSIPDAVRIVLDEYGAERLRPGDTLVVNDCYRVGTHFNDACCIRPVFSGEELVGAVAIRAHLLDVGGSVFGGFSVASRTTYLNGLRIPPMLLYSEGKPVESTFNLLYDNTRVAHLVVPDLQTEYQALALAEHLLQESIDRYGVDAYGGAIRYSCDASDEAMRDALGSVPDGVYEGIEPIITDGLPDSPEYQVGVRITKVGERAEFDLRASSPATRSSVNCTWLDAKTGVAMALKLLIDPRTPMTSGTMRSVDLIVAPGSICNPSPPVACQFYNDIVMAIVHAVFRALNPALGADAVGPGTGGMVIAVDTSSATIDEYPDIAAGLSSASTPWGATRAGDADSGQQNIYTNLNVNGGVEASETMFPEALLLRSEYQPDTGGAGTNRGGAATTLDVIVRTSNQLLPLSDGGVGGGGVHGGHEGARGESRRLEPGDPERATCLFASSVPGPVLRLVTGGGAGWGDPLARDPDRVLRDVRDGYVTVEGATRDYGVVVMGDPDRHPERIEVDVAATARCRAGLAAAPAPAADRAGRSIRTDDLMPPLEPVDGACPECGALALRRSPLLGADGWQDAVKCGACLSSISRTPWHRLGWVTLAEDA